MQDGTKKTSKDNHIQPKLTSEQIKARHHKLVDLTNAICATQDSH